MADWFTADTHFFHQQILAFTNRGFDNIETMNATMIKQWNRLVSNQDRVFHLGDVSFGNAEETLSVLNQLNGKIYLISGNHDELILTHTHLASRFVSIKPYQEITIDKRLLVLCHYPIQVWRNKHQGSWHLFGHTHGAVQLNGAALDVGIDNHPHKQLWSWQEIHTALAPIPALPYPN